MLHKELKYIDKIIRTNKNHNHNKTVLISCFGKILVIQRASNYFILSETSKIYYDKHQISMRIKFDKSYNR